MEISFLKAFTPPTRDKQHKESKTFLRFGVLIVILFGWANFVSAQYEPTNLTETIVLTEANIKANDYLVANDADNAGSWKDDRKTESTIEGYTGVYYNLSKTDRYITIKVKGVSKFEFLVQNQNKTDGRGYDVEVKDNKTTDAKTYHNETITHNGNNVESSGVIETGTTNEVTITIKGTGNGTVYPFAIRLIKTNALTLNNKVVSNPESFFKVKENKTNTREDNSTYIEGWDFNSKFTDCSYDGNDFTSGLKMNSDAEISFTTTELSTVTIVQSTWSSHTIKLNGNELKISEAETGEGCYIYTIPHVAAGTYTITRGSGETGLFYVKVEGETTEKEKSGINIVAPQYTMVYDNTTVYVDLEEDDTKKYTYQWYEATSSTNLEGTKITTGGTRASYSFTPSAIGTKYYYCEVTIGEKKQASRVAKVIITKANPKIIVDDMILSTKTGNTKSKKANFTATIGESNVNVKGDNYGLKFSFKIDSQKPEEEKKTVATTDANGTITAENPGTAKLKVTAEGDNFYTATGEATITVVNDDLLPTIVFTAYDNKDVSSSPILEAETDVYGKEMLGVKINLEDVPTGKENSYDIYYTTSEGEDVTGLNIVNGTPQPAATKYSNNEIIEITNTKTVKAAVWDKNNNKWAANSTSVARAERRFYFENSLFKTVTQNMNLIPGHGYTIVSDGTTYITATYGSKGDDGLWNTAKIDGEMNNSDFAGFEYHCIGTEDARGENEWDPEKYCYKSYDENTKRPQYNGDSSDLNTFSIPISGAYFMYEPEVDGTVTVVVRQNGFIGSEVDVKGTDGKKDLTDALKNPSKRQAYVCDETGQPISPEEGFAATISSNSLGEANAFAYGSTENPKFRSGDSNYDNIVYDYMIALYKSHYDLGFVDKDKYRDYRNKDNDDSELRDDALSYWRECEAKSIPSLKNVNGTITYDSQADKCNLPNVLIREGNGYYLLGKAYVKYSFPVKAGKTYFLMGNGTKLAPCGYSFTRNYKDYDTWEREVRGNGNEGTGRRITIDGTSTDKKVELPDAIAKGQYRNESGGWEVATNNELDEYRITLKRKFEAGYWTSLVLPFSISPTTVKEIFGEGTEILHFTAVEEIGKTGKLHMTKHYHQMIVAGTPVIIKPANTVENVKIYGTYEQLKESVEPEESVKPIKPVEQVDLGNGWTVMGSYTPEEVPEGAYIMAYKKDDNGNAEVNNMVHITNGNLTVAGTRAWIYNTVSPTSLLASSATINGIEDTTTTMIEDLFVNADSTPSKGVRVAGVYNLNGQMVRKNTTDTTGLPAGIYIAGGKKVVVK